jgi:Fur family ferric uptake transcriptional regulator
MEEHEKMFKQYLEKKGLKLTSPRRHILEAVFSLHEHFNAEELYGKIKAVTNGISLATVYRTLPLLKEAGLVQHALRSAGRERYEHIYGHPKHIHWLCRKCGVLMETNLQSLSPAIDLQAKGLQFKAEEIELSIRGLCWKCFNAENENHIDEK